MKRFFRIRSYLPDPDRDIQEEMESHLELKVEELTGQGMSTEEAWTEALRAFGDRECAQIEASSHDRARLRRRSLLDQADNLVRDVRYALRRMARRPGFTFIAILSLAIGIGANTAVFSVVNAFLIRKAPFRTPEELVRVYTSVPQRSPHGGTSYPDYLVMREMGGAFAGVGVSELLFTVAHLGDEPRRVLVEAVSASLLPLLGVEPVLGRGFLPEEDVRPGEHPVAILAHGFWQQAFGADPNVLGRTLTVAGRPHTIVGVAPDWFGCSMFTGLRMDLFVPVTMAATAAGNSERIYRSRSDTRFNLGARLAPGVTAEEAQSRLNLLAAQLQEAYPETSRDRTFRVIPFESVAISPELDQGLELTAVFLLVVVGLVLLLACTNLASLLLASGVERQREVAMRIALGASRGRLVRQILTETLLLGLAGGLAGLVVARVTLALVLAYQPPIPVSLSLELGLDRTVFLFTLGISVMAGILFGLAPALQSTRPDIAPTLKGEGSLARRRRFSLQTVLVTLQMAISMILLVGGGLFLRSLLNIQGTDPGFSTQEAGIAWLDLSASQVSRDSRDAVRIDLEERLLGQPGIHTVTSASRLPLSLGNNYYDFRIPGVDPPSGRERHSIDLAQVAPGYFRTLEIPILAGRAFTPDDRLGAPGVVVVSQEMAKTFWPGEDPFGKEIFRGSAERPLTVVGVAQDTKVGTLGESPRPYVYFPISQDTPGNLTILVRGHLPPSQLVATLRRVIREAYPNMVVMEVKTMEEHLSVRLFGSRAAALLLGAFGILALLLSSIGLYGIVSFSVSRRVREMGIRMSLGAGGREVVWMVVRGAMGVVLVGGLAGLCIAVFLARLIRAFLAGIQPGDPITMVGVPLLLGGVALLAALVPALRSTRVNPVEALRTE